MKNVLSLLTVRGKRVLGFILPMVVLGLFLSAPAAQLVASMDFTPLGAEVSPRNSAHTLAGSPPMFLATPLNPAYGDPGVNISFLIVVYDPDNDNINVTWDWGDGTPVGTNYTDPAGGGIIVIQEHAWDPIPEPGRGDYYIDYYLNITLDDGNGNTAESSTIVSIHIPENNGPSFVRLLGPTGVVDPNDTVSFSANASDPNGDPLTWTFVFNNSVYDYNTSVYTTGWTDPNVIVWMNITHKFGAVGNYTVTVYVSDALPPYQVFPHNISITISVSVKENLPPGGSTFISVTPPTPVIDSTVGYITVNYSVEVYDPDGDVITAVWSFSDNDTVLTNVSLGGAYVLYLFVVQRNYTDAGIYNVTVNITDGRPGHEFSLNKSLLVNSTNMPPSLTSFEFRVTQGKTALPNETVDFIINITDREHDAVFLTVDWGDNSSREYYNLTDYNGDMLSVTLAHKFVEPGNYTVRIWYTDNKIGLFNHYKNYSANVSVVAPVIYIKEGWSLWDYTSLVLVLMIPVLAALRFFYVARKRREAELEGMTLEEWKLVRSEMGEQFLKQREKS